MVMQQRIIYDRGLYFNIVLQFVLCHLLARIWSKVRFFSICYVLKVVNMYKEA